MVEVTNMNNNNRAVANQFIIRIDSNAVYFKSYDSIIVKETIDNVYLDKKYWKYSRTTIKYRNIFLNEDTATVNKKVESGLYKLVDLSKEAIQ